jgi:uncharacterized protein
MNELIQFGILNFFKVIILLFIFSGAMGFLRTYLPEKRIKEILDLEKGIKGHFKASLLGAATPFSSKSFNLFANFLEAGVPTGLAFSFLLTSPIINEFIVLLMLVFFGWKITLIYVLIGLIIGTFVGLVMSKLKLENYLVDKIHKREILIEKKKKVKNRLEKGILDGVKVVKKIWFFIFIGIILQIFIQGFIPEESITNLVEFLGIFGIPFVILLGTPFSGSGAVVIPVAMAFFEKGIPLGTTFAFLVSLVSISLHLSKGMKKIMKKKLIIIFFSIVIASIMVISYFLNYFVF